VTSLREIREQLARRGLRLGMTPEELRGQPGLHGRIVAAGTNPGRPTPEPEQGPCCGHCAEAARKLRERTQATPLYKDKLDTLLSRSLAELELSVRMTNFLESAGIFTVRDLVMRTEDEMPTIRSFGKVSLREVRARLTELWS
jgi:DNA-directed RNA polymerase alpha subunit